MPPRSVLLTYTLHPAPHPHASSSTSNSPLQTALEGIRRQTPLTNLHWKPSSRTSLRTIQSLDVNLVELGEVGTLGKEVAGSVLEWPLVNLCFVTCENDEVYKNQTRSFIRDWLSLLAARKNAHTPLIVLVNTPSTAASSGKNVYGRDKGVIAKLRTDFNTAKRDKCVQINLPPGGKDDPAVWVEIINKLKESIVSAFDEAIVEREEDIKRGEAQRLTVGWNFCTWFLLKESLAYSFEGVNLYEDALVVYEELEAAFIQVVKEQNLSWFGKLGATGSRDDSLAVLDTAAKPYRELLQTSSISIFDFRVYVFARQALLLGKLGRITEIAKRGQWFVASLARRLRENELDLAENFIESWTFTACMDIVHRCDEWSRIDRPNGDYSGLIAYESARSELLDIARAQVERIGVSAGHLPNEYPFAASSTPAPVLDDVLFESSDNGLSDAEDEADKQARPTLSNRQLVEAIASRDTFDTLYITLTKRAIAAYEACHKANSTVRLKANLAALALLKEDWSTAYDLCRALAKDSAEQHVWEPAAKFALAGALKAHRHLNMEKQEDWINLALAYLRVCAIASEAKAIDEELQQVTDGLSASETPHLASSHNAFMIDRIDHQASYDGAPDTSSVQVEIRNKLSTGVRCTEISLRFADAEEDEIFFTAEHVELAPGSNKVVVTSNTTTQGLFILRETRIALGQVVFDYQPNSEEAQLELRRNPRAPQLILRMPYDISLDKNPSVVLEIHSGESDLTDAEVVLVSAQDDVGYQLEAVTSEYHLQASRNLITLGDVNAGSLVTITVPYVGNASSDWTKARSLLRYRTAQGQPRVIFDHHEIAMSLPLTVNVQDFFRPKSLISHFTIASDGREHLRIASVNLVEVQESAYTVESARKNWGKPLIVMPSQPLSCLFKITKTSQNPSAALRLVIKYRGVDEGRSGPTSSSTKRKSTLLGLSDDKWRTLEIPVDVPQRRLLTSVRFEHLSPSKAVYEGRAISLRMKFDSTFEWLGDEDGATTRDQSEIEIFWDISVSQDDWIVLGRKKGHHAAKDGATTHQDIVLVPVRSGKLFLPAVHARLLKPKSVLDGRRSSVDRANGHSSEDAGDGIICETHVENAAEVIDVLSATKSRTVLVPLPIRDGWDV